MKPPVLDRHGRPVTVGARVRVLSVPAYQIEGHAAWVEKVWRTSDGEESHALALDTDEMELA